jgi:hypothetical protein
MHTNIELDRHITEAEIIQYTHTYINTYMKHMHAYIHAYTHIGSARSANQGRDKSSFLAYMRWVRQTANLACLAQSMTNWREASVLVRHKVTGMADRGLGMFMQGMCVCGHVHAYAHMYVCVCVCVLTSMSADKHTYITCIHMFN